MAVAPALSCGTAPCRDAQGIHLPPKTGRSKLPEQYRRLKAAAAAANKYAPRPEGSSATYGLIAVVLAFLGLVSFGMFYKIDVLAHPAFVGVGLAVVFVLGILLRKRRRRLHGQAFKHELGNQDDLPSSE